MNSLNTCLQAPHGPVGSSESGVQTAMAVKRRYPKAAAVVIEFRSAQVVNPKERFSTFTPVIIFPSSQSKAAPTLKFE
jgi:hypothetical protein